MNHAKRNIGKALDYALGLGGALVCAGVATVGAYYLSRVFGFGLLWVGVTMAVSFILFAILGLVAPRYFAYFSAPVINGLSDGGSDDSRRVVVVSIWLVLSLLLLTVGAVFRVHPIFAAGLIAFLAYAICVRKVIS